MDHSATLPDICYTTAWYLYCVWLGSKLVPFWSWLQMAKDLLLISLRYLFAIWTVSPENKKSD